VLPCGAAFFSRSVWIAELCSLPGFCQHPVLGWRMSLDIKQLIAEREDERYELHANHLNEQMVHVLKTHRFR
jgi:hypothetical protein